MRRIDELASSFAEIEGRGTSTSVFQEMARILTGQGVDEAIAYVASQRSSILEAVRARAASARERNRADLEPLLKAAALYENKGQPVKARALYRDILTAEPDWPDALHACFSFLVNQGKAACDYATLADALLDFEEGQRLAKRLTISDPSNPRWQRDLAASYNWLGNTAVAQGNLGDAARNYDEYMAIAKKLAASDPSNAELQRDVAVSYNKLGDVAFLRGKLVDAARDYNEELAIAEKLAAEDPSNTEWQRDLAVSYERRGSVAKAQGELEEACAGL